MSNTDIQGSARWAKAQDLEEEGLFWFNDIHFSETDKMNSSDARLSYINDDRANRCMVLGRCAKPEDLLQGIRQDRRSFFDSVFEGLSNMAGGHHGKLMGWAGDGHIITIAPTRSGKGVGLVVPNLLHYPGSAVVIDPKGENYAITAEFRENTLGQQIVCLDPFRVLNSYTNSINPLDCFEEGKYELWGDEASNIADAMIIRDVGARDTHWDDKARTLLKALILYVMCRQGPRRQRHLAEVRELLCRPQALLRHELMLMSNARQNPTIRSAAEKELLERAANEVLSCGENELMSIISSALKHTEFLESPLVSESLGKKELGGRGDYAINDLKTEGGVTIYMVIPPQHMARYARLIRLWITMSMTAMTRTVGKPADGCPVLFMLDEMAQLGTLPMMKQAVSLLAGYGMSIWMIWQDLSQLKALYKHDWPTFLANAKIQQFFGINDHETAKYISEMLGTATLTAKSESSSKNKKTMSCMPESTSTSESYSEVSRNLLNPDEVRRLNREVVLTFVQGIPPIMTKRISYYADPMFKYKASPNPFRESDSLKKR